MDMSCARVIEVPTGLRKDKINSCLSFANAHPNDCSKRAERHRKRAPRNRSATLNLSGPVRIGFSLGPLPRAGGIPSLDVAHDTWPGIADLRRDIVEISPAGRGIGFLYLGLGLVPPGEYRGL